MNNKEQLNTSGMIIYHISKRNGLYRIYTNDYNWEKFNDTYPNVSDSELFTRMESITSFFKKLDIQVLFEVDQ